jgi:hypothetical protein
MASLAYGLQSYDGVEHKMFDTQVCREGEGGRGGGLTVYRTRCCRPALSRHSSFVVWTLTNL